MRYLKNEVIATPFFDLKWDAAGKTSTTRFTGVYTGWLSSPPFSATNTGITGVPSNIFFRSAHSILGFTQNWIL